MIHNKQIALHTNAMQLDGDVREYALQIAIVLQVITVIAGLALPALRQLAVQPGNAAIEDMAALE